MEKRLDSLSLLPHSFIEGEDPWDELLQSGCEFFCKNQDPIQDQKQGQIQEGAGTIQPLVLPSVDAPREPYRKLRSIEQYRRLRSIWTQENHPPISLNDPLIQNFQPSMAIAHLLAKRWECLSPPLAPILFPSGGALCDIGATHPSNRRPQLPELCQLALLWMIAGEKEAALRLIHWLLPFAKEKPLLSLWCPEDEFDEKEGLLSFSLLLRAVRQNEKAAELLRYVKKPIDPFFIALAKAVPVIEETVIIEDSTPVSDPVLGLSLHQHKTMTSAFTLTGWGSSMGMIRTGDVEIRAMGPQILPLTDAKRFGISRVPNGSPIGNWTRCLALPEVWIEVKTEVKTGADDAECGIDLRFIGLKPETPLLFVFYVKAQSCQIGNSLLKPKSLYRYSGEAKSLFLKGNEGGLKLESSLSHKVQVIPLAGEGCFWDAEFLISFEIHPVTALAQFRLGSC